MGVPRRFYATTGIPVSRDGMKNESENLTMAARAGTLTRVVRYIAERCPVAKGAELRLVVDRDPVALL